MKKTTLNLLPRLAVILATLAILAGCASTSRSNLAGRINGTPIQVLAFWNSYRGHYNNFQIVNKRTPDKDEIALIKRQTWNDAAKHVILNDYFEKYGIRVTHQEVIDTLKQSIPDYILSSPKFKTDGKFDTRIYYQSLQYDTPENLRPLREDYQEYKIPILKLQKHLIKDELLTPERRKEITKILQSKADIEWTVIDARDIDPYISDSEIQVYYEKNMDQYKLEPDFSLNWVSLGVTPSKTDTRVSAALADSIHSELQKGSSVADIMERYMPQFPHLVFKNSGFVKNSDLDPRVYAALSQLGEGKFSQPLGDEDGYRIHQLEQRTKSMCSFNTLFIPYVPSKTSIELELARVQRVAALARQIGLENAAYEMDLQMRSSGKLTPKDIWTDDPAVMEHVRQQLAKKQAGYIFEPVYSDVSRAWLVLELHENNPQNLVPLEKAGKGIRAKLSEEKSRGMARNLARDILAGRQEVPEFAQTILMEDMDRSSCIGGMSFENVFYETLRRHYKDESQICHQAGDRFFIPRVISVDTDPRINVSEDDIRRVFTANLPEDWFSEWMEEQLSEAEIEIYID